PVTRSPQSGLWPRARCVGCSRAWKLRGWRPWSRMMSWYSSLRSSFIAIGSSAEHFAAGLDRVGQAVDVGFVVIDPERGPHRAGEAELVHQRLGAVMPDPDGNMMLVEHGADIMRVDAVEV